LDFFVIAGMVRLLIAVKEPTPATDRGLGVLAGLILLALAKCLAALAGLVELVLDFLAAAQECPGSVWVQGDVNVVEFTADCYELGN
jgi:hypothetical protein